MEIRVSEGCIGFWLELWGALPDAFNLSIRTPGGENIPELRLGLQQSVTYSFIYEKSRVTIDSALVEENSGEELILVRIQDPTPGTGPFMSLLPVVYITAIFTCGCLSQNFCLLRYIFSIRIPT